VGGPGLASLPANLGHFQKVNPRSDIMATLANPANITSRGLTRTIFRWVHIVLAIPILGYIYSPFDKLPDYAFKTRFIFVPIMVLSGLWMWKGHVVRRLLSKKDRPKRKEEGIARAGF
jgi:hypothetical protein